MPTGTQYPIFQEYSIEELSRRLVVSKGYIVALMEGNKPIRPKFRDKAANTLGRPVAELFGPEEG